MAKTSTRRSTWRAVASATIALALTVVIAQPASANQTTLTGNGYVGVVKAWDTPRTNTYSQSYVAFQQTGNGAGGSLWLALRNTSGSTFARGQSGGAWATIYNDNGNPYQPSGTFYLNSELTGACGGSGCGLVNWSANFQWNIKWN
jgi:hypothetical protein